MHAVVVKVSIEDVGPAEEYLKEEIVPQVSQVPGFVGGYWTRSDDGGNGMSMMVFESEDAAKGIASRLPQEGNEAVTIENVEVREVVASA